MKKSKRQQTATETAAVVAPKPSLAWWPWAAALAALYVVFEIYSPSMNGPFVLDDRFLPFFNPQFRSRELVAWMAGLRPALMFTYWVNFMQRGQDPYIYHLTNVLLHFATSILITLIVARLLGYAGVEGRMRAALALFAGGLFLVHPLQTETVSYVASRSDGLAGFFYFGAYCVFLYGDRESFGWGRALAVLALFGAALASKEHTLTLPVLLLLTDFFFIPGGFKKHAKLYGMMAVAAAIGAVGVYRVLAGANTAGFGLRDLTPIAYFFSQCRVLWTYIRMFVLPAGQNVDPDVPISHTPLEHGAVIGMVALLALVGAAWFYRKRWPLAAFGVFAFIILIAPTSSIVPIQDLLAERRVYLPILGLELIALEIVRRLRFPQVVGAGAVVLLAMSAAAYQRASVWGSSIALWEDAVSKSPEKARPRFQLAYAYYEVNQCGKAAAEYEVASKLQPPDYRLLVDWGLALDCAGSSGKALEKLQEAARFEHTAHAYSTIGMLYGKQGQWAKAMEALDEAERLDRNYEMTYVYKGNVLESQGDTAGAQREYLHALQINPDNEAARIALPRVRR